MKNLVGQTFGRWKVLEMSPIRTNDKRIQYLCECSCEAHTQKLVSGKNLLNGMSQSCGCLQRERTAAANKGNTYGKANTKDLANQRFGNLIALKRLETKTKGCWNWECLCDCGNKIISNTRDLNGGRKTRCDNCSLNATISKGEEAIINLFKINNIDFETQKVFNNCILASGSKAKFDFYVNNQYLIEFDGEQHFRLSETSAWRLKLDKIKENDIYKNKWCKANNIPLIRIPYTHLKDLRIEDLLLETSNFIYKGL